MPRNPPGYSRRHLGNRLPIIRLERSVVILPIVKLLIIYRPVTRIRPLRIIVSPVYIPLLFG